MIDNFETFQTIDLTTTERKRPKNKFVTLSRMKTGNTSVGSIINEYFFKTQVRGCREAFSKKVFFMRHKINGSIISGSIKKLSVILGCKTSYISLLFDKEECTENTTKYIPVSKRSVFG